MNILFITSNRLGDAALSTGLLDHIVRSYPESSITIACGKLPSSLFEGVPNLKEVIAFDKQSHHKHWLDLWRKVSKTRWDLVVDLRDSAVSRLILAKKRFVFSRHIDKKLHKVEQCAAVMKLPHTPSPHLWFSEGQMEKATELIPDGGDVLAVGPAANWIGKTWPADRFIDLVAHIRSARGILPGARVAVFAAPGEEEIANEVLNSVPEERRLDVIAKADPGVVVASLSRCSFYLGNDSGLMHCAAAVGVPTVGLFGPSYPQIYKPWGSNATYVRTPETFDELIDFDGYNTKTLDRSLMDSLELDEVINAIHKFWDKLSEAA
jgi:lipopolysaccharide export system permease protein